MTKLVGGPAHDHDVDTDAVRSPLSIWVTLLDGRPHILDMTNPAAARDLLRRAHRGDDGEAGPGWDEYERDRRDPGVYRFVPVVKRH